MKTPPFLLGAALLFWGWQTEFLVPGAIMALVLEGSRFVKTRLELSDQDFKRVWTFCALLFLAAAVYAFADNGGPAGVGRLFQRPNLAAEQYAGSASARTAAELIRWLPMIFGLFTAAQAFSSQQEIPLHTISLVLQRRRKLALKRGLPLPPDQAIDVTYPYFGLCVFAASVHQNENNSYFWGLCVLLAWALWMRRPQRFGAAVWASALVLAVILGYSGARGIGVIQRYVEGLNAQWLAQFLARNQTDASVSRTQIGHIGRIKTSARIVIELQPKSGEPPVYLREASYRVFHSPEWISGSGFRNGFTQIKSSLTNENTFSLLDVQKPNASRVQITCFLHGRSKYGNSSGLLPLPTGSARLENLAAYELTKNSGGSVLVSEGPGLVQFDALYGPGATMDGPPETNAPTWGPADPHESPFFAERTNGIDLQIPTNEIPALEEVVAELGLRSQSQEQALQSISKFFRSKFTYRTWQDGDDRSGRTRTALSRFLLQSRAGHCEYFATATVLLLREIGIPARYAVGYSIHEISGNNYIVRQRDAHAWCLMWNEQSRLWENFDTTPADWREAESQRSAASVWLADLWWQIHFQIAKFRWGQTHLREYILMGLVPVLVILLVQILRQHRRRAIAGAGSRHAIAWPGLDSEFYKIEKHLAERGVPRAPNETLGDWLKRAAGEPSFGKLKNPLHNLLRLHYRYRFDPRGVSDSDRENLREAAHECLDELALSKNRLENQAKENKIRTWD